MKRSVIAAAIAATLVTGPTFGQTAIQAGLWEVTDKTTLEGIQPMPSAAKRVCVKGGEAILERLLYPTPDDFAKHCCTFSPGPKQPGIFKATTVCPPTDETPGVTARGRDQLQAGQLRGPGRAHGQGQGRHDRQRQQRAERQARGGLLVPVTSPSGGVREGAGLSESDRRSHKVSPSRLPR